jgi:hypothetical protein
MATGVARGPKRTRRLARNVKFVLDSLPYILTGVLGAWVMLGIHWTLAALEMAAMVLGNLWIILKVCPSCSLHGSPACASGFGLASGKLTRRGDPDRFEEVFSHHMTAVMPMWFIPLAGVAYLLLTGQRVPWLLLAVFLVVAFVVVPLKARYITCARCPKRGGCPWGKRTARRRRNRTNGSEA